jgi:hypothetical protein
VWRAGVGRRPPFSRRCCSPVFLAE